MHPILAGLALATLTATSDAQACGGFFCDVVPVDQAAERILFTIDEEADQVEVQVQITYQGEADAFAWILPVPAEPVLRTTVDDVFLRLSPPTMPRWTLTMETNGTCKGGTNRGVGVDDVDFEDAEPPQAGGVEVSGEGTVGPYEFAILRADDADTLLDWLRTRLYIIPADVDGKLAPYIADESWFVALRLSKDQDVGDMRPIALTYAGTEPQIPLQLTAVAATPDMRLQPFILGSARAVPENYLHVTINPFAVDWLRGGANYQDVVAAAADVAGGKAFATDFAGPADVLDGVYWSPGAYDLDGLRSLGETSAATVVNGMQAAGIPLTSGTLPFLRARYTLPTGMLDRYGITDLQAYASLDAYDETARATMDAVALADALEDPEMGWVPAMKHAQDLVDGSAWLTRMTSSMDAEEMTLDPLFVLNKDLQPVSNQHDARLIAECGASLFTFEDAPRRLVLPDGRSLLLPADYVNDPNFDYTAWIGPLGDMPAETIEQGGRSGGLVLITDNGAAIDTLLSEASAMVPSCGCDTRGGGAGAVLASFALLLGLRRRRG